MDIKRATLLIGLAVITNGCLTSDHNKRHTEPQISHQTPPYQNSYSTPAFSLPPQTPSYQINDINNYNKDNNEYENRQSTSDTKEISRDIALDVLELSQQLTKRKLETRSTSKYEVLSPISITSALQLAFLAAKGNTFDELKKLFKHSADSYKLNEMHRQFGAIIKDLQNNEANPQRENVNWRANARPNYIQKYMRGQDKNPNYDEHKIEMANGIFIQKGVSLRHQYEDVVKGTYQSDIETLDFMRSSEESAAFINNWVNLKTHGKIPSIVPRLINPNTRVILANALYFKAEWQASFIDGVTMRKKFYPNGRNNNESIDVNLMAHGGHFPHYFDAETNSDILGFPYKQNSTTMYVILPRDSNRQRLVEVQGQLTAVKIEKMIDSMTIKSAVALFPKMHLSSSHYLKNDLQEMGVNSLFNEQSSDLSLLVDCSPGSKIISCHNRNDVISRVHFPASRDETNRFSNSQGSRSKRGAVSYKTPSEDKDKQHPLNFKDFLLKKRLLKNNVGDKKKTVRRSKRDTIDDLEAMRLMPTNNNPGLFADEVIHKVDLSINEKGTEGGAATAITLNRSGTQVVFRVDTPFLFLIRHDPTRIPLFYGAVIEPPLDD